jgi:pimeloyl-ACP methyl ester carboxylesterase
VSARTGFAPVEGTRLFHEVSGEGLPVVLVHGRGLDHRMWAPQVDALSAGHRLVRYDLRGFGRSPSGGNAYSHADDLAALLDHLGIDRAVVVGCSLGGGAAVNFAVLHPRRLLGLVTVGGSLGGFPWSQAFQDMFREAHRIALESGPQAANEFYLGSSLFAHAHHSPEVERRTRELLRDDDGAHWTRPDLGRPLSPPASERLGSITAPTLVVVGEYDVPDMLAIADILAGRVPGARKVLLDGLGHLPSLEDPGRFNRLVLEFVDGLQR